MHCSHLLFIVQVCPYKLQHSDSKEKLLLEKYIKNVIVHILQQTRSVPVQKLSQKTPTSNKTVSVCLQLSTKSSSKQASPRKRSPNFRNQSTGWSTSHLKQSKTWSHSDYTLTLEGRSLLQRSIHSMTHSLGGNSIY